MTKDIYPLPPNWIFLRRTTRNSFHVITEEILELCSKSKIIWQLGYENTSQCHFARNSNSQWYLLRYAQRTRLMQRRITTRIMETLFPSSYRLFKLSCAIKWCSKIVRDDNFLDMSIKWMVWMEQVFDHLLQMTLSFSIILNIILVAPLSKLLFRYLSIGSLFSCRTNLQDC